MKNVPVTTTPVVPAGGGPAVPAVPAQEPVTDLHHATRRRVARSILENGPSTANELADRLALTAAAVRRHLDALTAEGLLEAHEQRPIGRRGRGRPARVFALTPSGRRTYHQAYDDLAAAALRWIAGRGGPDALAAFAEERLRGLGERVAPAVAAAARPDRVGALADALSAEGYAASARSTGSGGAQLCQHHCPVAQVAEQFPQLCEAETALFARLLGTHVQRLATIAHGDGVCTTHVPGQPPGQAYPTPQNPVSAHTSRRTSA